jgi:mono/diheme cytochrome c family protein
MRVLTTAFSGAMTTMSLLTASLRLCLTVAVVSVGMVDLCGIDAASDPAALRMQAERTYSERIKPLLTTHCVACHGGKKTKGDLDLARIGSSAAAVANRALWVRVRTELKHGTMPPENEPQPSADETKTMLAWIQSLKSLDQPDPGRTTIRRLNRLEYRNTIRDLLGVEIDPTTFPADDIGNGFDNIAEVLSTSPLLMEKYLLAADAVLDQVVIDDQVKLTLAATEMSAVVDGKPQAPQVLPTGKLNAKPVDAKPVDAKQAKIARLRTFTGPGEISTVFSVPKEGRFTIKVRAGAEQAGREPVRLAVKVDDQVVQEVKVTAKSPATHSCTVTLPPGPKRLSVIFLNPYTESAEEAVANSKGGAATAANAKAKEPLRRTRAVTFDGIEIQGPPAATPTERHKRLVVAVPGKELSERDAAKQVAERFATRAFRKPATNVQIDRLLKVFDLADGQGEVYSESIKLMIKAALISPEFCFRLEDDLPAGKDGVQPVGAWDLATRLSYLLWSTMPDEELLTLAKDDRLRDPSIIETQVRRMLADPRALAFVESFAGQWLELRRVLEATPDPQRFPEFTKELRKDLHDEGLALFGGILREGRSLLELIDCDYAWLNERLAKHYGISGVSGPHLRRVQLSDRTRGGVIGLGALLTVTSHTASTSPVKRGKWVLEEMLGEPPPSPPAMVPPLDEERRKVSGQITLRQLLERHRSDAGCASCHRTMDAIGFGLENFNAIGRWRDRDDGGMVDASGELPGGRRFTGPAQLKAILLAQQDDFARLLTTKLLTYALGRRVEDHDDQAIERIITATRADGWKLDRMLIEVCRSYPFLNRRAAQ